MALYQVSYVDSNGKTDLQTIQGPNGGLTTGQVQAILTNAVTVNSINMVDQSNYDYQNNELEGVLNTGNVPVPPVSTLSDIIFQSGNEIAH